jgi:hypothetical protein
MNDLEILDHTFAPAPPSDDARREARTALLARGRPRRRRAPLRVAAIATAAAITAAFLLVVQNLGDSGPVAAAEVFERAAQAAETKPFVEPGLHQWIYTEDRIVTSDDPTPYTRTMWHRVDSGGIAWIDDRGKVRIREFSDAERPQRGAPFDSYEELTKLPTDPDALLRWAYEQADHVEGAGLTEDGDVYAIFSGVLGANVLPPDLEAGIFRALERVPGVTVSTVDVFGERVLSLAQTEDWLREELFLDPETYAYRGQRGTVVHDATINPEKAGNATGEIEAGHTATSIRVKSAIVDAPPD